MNPSTLTEVQATIEAIWKLEVVWQQSQFPLLKLLEDPGSASSNTSAVVGLFDTIHKTFVSRYITGQIDLSFLEQSYMVRTKVNCPGNVGLKYLRIDQSFADEYVFDSHLFAQPHRVLVDMAIGKEQGDVVTDVSVKPASYDPSDKKKHNASRPDYITMREQQYSGRPGPRDNCAFIRRFASFLFFTRNISPYLNADKMEEIGPIYSALLLMAHDIIAVGVDDAAVSTPTPLANKYRPAINRVMKAAQQVYQCRRGINSIQPSTFNQLLDQSAGPIITPVSRSTKGTLESPLWQDHARNRHRPSIRLELGIPFKAAEWRISSGFYGSSTDDVMRRFPSSMLWNYPSSAFLYASTELAADMIKSFETTDFKSLQEMVQLATQFVLDLSRFQVSFMDFFRTEWLFSML